MTELAKHIEILLLDNDCVIVPGFGGFMAHQASSVYSNEENLFLPPSRTLGFNPQLKINDSLLAQSYVEAYDISYPEAIRKIEGEVNEIRQTLTNTGCYELPDIGMIISKGDDSYDFEPCLSGLLTPDLYALSSFEMPMLSGAKPVADTEDEQKETLKVETKPVVAPIIDIQDEANNNNELLVEDDDDSSARVISINVNTLKKVVASAAIVIFLVLFSLPLGENMPLEERLCTIDSGMLLKIMPHVEQNGTLPSIASEMKIAEGGVTVESTNQAVESQPVDVQTTPAVEKKVNISTAEIKGNYVIVLSCSSNKASMQRHADRLKKKGVADARVLEGQGCLKIVTGSFKEKRDAVKAFHELKASVPTIKDGWYYKII